MVAVVSTLGPTGGRPLVVLDSPGHAWPGGWPMAGGACVPTLASQLGGRAPRRGVGIPFLRWACALLLRWASAHCVFADFGKKPFVR